MPILSCRVGAGGAWTDWLVHTAASSAIFGSNTPELVLRGETYYFRARVYDRAGNMEDYPAGNGDTSTSIDEVFLVFAPIITKQQRAV